MIEEQSRLAFEALVLQGIWVIIRTVMFGMAFTQANNWRAHAIEYLDRVGNPSEEAKRYRREVGFWS